MSFHTHLFKIGVFIILALEVCSGGDSCQSVSLTFENFDKLANGGILVLKIFTPWCEFCKNLEPTWIKLEQLYCNDPNIIFGQINSDLERKLAMRFNTTIIPQIYITESNRSAYIYRGIRGEKEIKDWIFDSNYKRYEKLKILTDEEVNQLILQKESIRKQSKNSDSFSIFFGYLGLDNILPYYLQVIFGIGGVIGGFYLIILFLIWIYNKSCSDEEELRQYQSYVKHRGTDYNEGIYESISTRKSAKQE